MNKLNRWKILPNTSYSYNESNIIGNGAYGEVYLGIDKNTEDYVAVKIIDKEFINRHGKTTQIMRELDFFSRKDNRHENIVNCLSVYEDERSYYLVTEYCEGGDLSKYLAKKKEISESEAIDIMVDILNGYSYLKSLGYIHRDLKTENILIKHGKYKICDFGSIRSNLHGLLTSAAPGTQVYMSPEMLIGTEIYDYKTDIWSLGIIFFELLYSKLPFENQNQMKLLEDMQKSSTNMASIFPKDKTINSETKNLIIRMLDYNKEKRISFEELSHSALFITDSESRAQQKIKRRHSLENKDFCQNFDSKTKSLNEIDENDKSPSVSPKQTFIITSKSKFSPSNNIIHVVPGGVTGSKKNSNYRIHLFPQLQQQQTDCQIESLTPKSKIVLTEVKEKKQKITIVAADETAEKDLMKLSDIIGLKNEGMELIREKLLFEVEIIGLLKKMIESIRNFASMNSLEILKYFQLSFPLAQIAWIKYTTLINPLFLNSINTFKIPEKMWDIIKNNPDLINIITTVRNYVQDQETLYPKFFNLVKNNIKKPTTKIDKKFLEILIPNMTDKNKVLNFLEEILNQVNEDYQKKTPNATCDIVLKAMFDLVKMLKSEEMFDILYFYKSHQL